MDISLFYNFSSKPVSTTLTFSPTNISFKNGDVRKLIRGHYEGLQFPIICEYDQGKNMRDILNTGYASLHLISDKFKHVLEKNDVTGWKVYPVKLIDKKGNEVNGFHGLSVTGRCGPIDYTRSEIIEKRFVPEGPLCKLYKGTYIGLDQWDGSDLFLPVDSTRIMISARALKILKENKISNIYVLNLAEEETDDFVVETILKHRRENTGSQEK